MKPEEDPERAIAKATYKQEEEETIGGTSYGSCGA